MKRVSPRSRLRLRAMIALTAALGLAVTPAPALSQQPRAVRLPTFGAGVSLVRIGVVVRDKAGALVRGLKREDFTITEDGKPQPIEVFDFEEVSTERAAAAAEPAALESPVPAVLKPAAAKTPAAPPPSDQPADFGGKRLVVLLFDSSGMEPEQLERATESARKYIEERMTPFDLVAVASIGPVGLDVGQDFTADRERLRRAIDRIAGFDDSSAADTAAADIAASDDPSAADSFTPDTTELDLFNIDRRLRAIEDLSKALAPIVQKKSVIYFSNGMSGVTADNQVELRAAIDGAVKANLSVYPVDARGLEAVVPGGDARQASRGGSDVFSGRATSKQFTDAAASQDSLASLASDTGGKTFFDTNDFTGAFDRVVADTSAYYILGYTSANPAKDGRFRRVKVAVTRPDLRVEHRSGYYAERDFAHAGKDDRDLQLQDQLFTDLSATDFPVWVQADHFRTAADRYYVPLSVAVPGSALFPQGAAAPKPGAHGALSLDLIGVVRDEAKRAVARLRDTVRVEATEGVRGKNVQYRTGFTLPPGKYSLPVNRVNTSAADRLNVLCPEKYPANGGVTKVAS